MEHPYNPSQIISSSMIALDVFLKKTPYYNDQYSYSDIIIRKIAHLLFNTKIKVISIILLFRVLPQVIVCSCFIYDILLNDKFHYFYKSLIILIFPLMIQYIIYSITTFIDTNLAGLNEALELRLINKEDYSEDIPLEYYNKISIYEWRDLLQTPEGTKYICHNNLSQEALKSFKGDIVSAKYSLEIAIDLMKDLFTLSHYVKCYKQYKFIIETPIKVVKYTIYIIGWSHICNLADIITRNLY